MCNTSGYQLFQKQFSFIQYNINVHPLIRLFMQYKLYIQFTICYTYLITIRTKHVIWKCTRIICQNNESELSGCFIQIYNSNNSNHLIHFLIQVHNRFIYMFLIFNIGYSTWQINNCIFECFSLICTSLFYIKFVNRKTNFMQGKKPEKKLKVTNV